MAIVVIGVDHVRMAGLVNGCVLRWARVIFLNGIFVNQGCMPLLPYATTGRSVNKWKIDHDGIRGSSLSRRE